MKLVHMTVQVSLGDLASESILLDDVMGSLVDQGAKDPSVEVTLSTGEVGIEVEAEEETIEKAVWRASLQVSRALARVEKATR